MMISVLRGGAYSFLADFSQLRLSIGATIGLLHRFERTSERIRKTKKPRWDSLLDEGTRASKNSSGIHHSGTGPFEHTALKPGVLAEPYGHKGGQPVKWKLAL
jgi:hypothetical protein